jgi:hypothetical protein
MSDSKDLTTVFRGSLAEAHLLQAVLDAQGFTTFVADTNAVALTPSYVGCGNFQRAAASSA